MKAFRADRSLRRARRPSGRAPRSAHRRLLRCRQFGTRRAVAGHRTTVLRVSRRSRCTSMWAPVQRGNGRWSAVSASRRSPIAVRSAKRFAGRRSPHHRAVLRPAVPEVLASQARHHRQEMRHGPAMRINKSRALLRYKPGGGSPTVGRAVRATTRGSFGHGGQPGRRTGRRPPARSALVDRRVIPAQQFSPDRTRYGTVGIDPRLPDARSFRTSRE